MPFDIDKLVAYCQSSVQQFAGDHRDEVFYAFAIDANMLCLNSLEQFAQTLHEYQSRWDRQTREIKAITDMTEEDWREEEFSLELARKYSGLDRNDDQAVLDVINEDRSRRRMEGCEYRSDAGIRSLRDNTGDWAYQGFADMDDEDGFDSDQYNDHYIEAGEADDGHAPHTAYAVAMTELVNRLRSSDIFEPLKLSDDFTISWVDHNY